MKNLLLLATLCLAIPAQALDKSNLDAAIRSFDITTVEQIITTEKFTSREYARYLSLAEEMVRNREMWLYKTYYYEDTSTTFDCSEAPSLGLMTLEFISGFPLIMFNGLSLWIDSSVTTNKEKIVSFAGTVLGVIFLKKSWDNYKKLLVMEMKHRAVLRKKYDDAIAIKQLIYKIDIVEA